MKTQHPYVHQCLKDILDMLSQRISSDFMNTKYIAKLQITHAEYYKESDNLFLNKYS